MHVLGIWFCNEDKYFHVIKLWIMPIAILTPENLFMKLNPLFRVLIKRYSFSMLMQRCCLQQFKNVSIQFAVIVFRFVTVYALFGLAYVMFHDILPNKYKRWFLP